MTSLRMTIGETFFTAHSLGIMAMVSEWRKAYKRYEQLIATVTT